MAERLEDLNHHAPQEPCTPRQILNESFKFIGVGLVATLTHFTVLEIFLRCVGLGGPTVATAVASLFGIAAAYIGNFYWTFQHSEQHARFIYRFFTTYLCTIMAHTGIMYLGTAWLQFGHVVVFVVATVFTTAANFLLSKFVVFDGYRQA